MFLPGETVAFDIYRAKGMGTVLLENRIGYVVAKHSYLAGKWIVCWAGKEISLENHNLRPVSRLES